jgi:hypothetical protein
MRTYTIHIPRRPWASPSTAIADTRAVKDGFCWPAFFFSFVWALWHRMWIVAAIIFVVELGVGFAIDFAALDGVTEAAISLGIALIVGWVANDLRRYELEKTDLSEGGVVLAATGEDAIKRFFSETSPRDGYGPATMFPPHARAPL